MTTGNPETRKRVRRWLKYALGAMGMLLLSWGASRLAVDSVLNAIESERAMGLSASTGPPLSVGMARLSAISEPQITRAASLNLVTRGFDQAQNNVKAIAQKHQGFFTEVRTSSKTGRGRTLVASMRVPAEHLDAAVADLRTLGRVAEESQAGEESSEESGGLAAQMANASATLERLHEMVRQRSGKVTDFLAVEQEITRTRAEVERLEATQRKLAAQVRYAAIQISLKEEYRAHLETHLASTFLSFRNATVRGLQSLVEGVSTLLVVLLLCGPNLLFWGLLLFWPARLAWRRWRAARPAQQPFVSVS